jgi:hypothetical protein
VGFKTSNPLSQVTVKGEMQASLQSIGMKI